MASPQWTSTYKPIKLTKGIYRVAMEKWQLLATLIRVVPIVVGILGFLPRSVRSMFVTPIFVNRRHIWGRGCIRF